MPVVAALAWGRSGSEIGSANSMEWPRLLRDRSNGLAAASSLMSSHVAIFNGHESVSIVVHLSLGSRGGIRVGDFEDVAARLGACVKTPLDGP